MNFFNYLYKSKIIKFAPRYFLKKLKELLNYHFVEVSNQLLVKNNHSLTITLDEQDSLIKNFDRINYIPLTTCPYIVQLLKLIFTDSSKEYNFLDFGGGKINHFLYLKKNFKKLKYFYFDQKENNEIIEKLKEKYLLKDIIVLNNLDEIKKNKYHFINLGSVIQYVADYKSTLNNLIETNPEYIFITAQTFFENKINEKEFFVVKQVNLLPIVNFCYFFEYRSFIKIFESKKFLPLFKTLNFTDRVNYNNFKKSYGKIEYVDLLFKNMN